MLRNRKTERNKEIYALRKAGAYYHQIAEQYGISIIRVRQIIEAEEAKHCPNCGADMREVEDGQNTIKD